VTVPVFRDRGNGGSSSRDWWTRNQPDIPSFLLPSAWHGD
jgi:hypothetical protein